MRMTAALVFTFSISVNLAQGFIFNNGPGGFGGLSCTPIHTFCPLQCPEYEKDGHGCPVCHCKGDGETGQLTGPDQGTDYHVIQHPCIPSQMNCPIKCHQFVQGAGGCEFCMCDTTHLQETTPTHAPTTTTHIPTTTPAPTVPPSTISQDCMIAKQICSAKCDGKYLVDPSDCTFCICKSEIAGR